MFKENKNVIIILTIIFLIIVVIVFSISLFVRERDEKKSENPILQNDSSVKVLTDKNLLLTVKQIVDGYLISLSRELYNQVYLLYTNSYVNNNNLSVDDVENIDKSLLGNYNYHVIDMYYSEGNKVTTVYCYGTIYGENDPIKSYYKILLDYNNNCYALEPIDEEKFNNYITGNQEIQYEEVTNNGYNKFEKAIINEPSMCTFYFSDYKYNVLYDQQSAYNNLSSWFIEEKFSSFGDFKKYLDDNSTNIKTSYMKEYQVYYTDNRTNYVCVDNNNLIYEFYVLSLFEYRMSFSNKV